MFLKSFQFDLTLKIENCVCSRMKVIYKFILFYLCVYVCVCYACEYNYLYLLIVNDDIVIIVGLYL